MKQGQPYPVRYTLETGEFNKGDTSQDQGLTEKLVYISCIEQPSGAYSQYWNSIDGSNSGEPMSHNDVFKAWIMMGKTLAEKEDLAAGKRQTAEFAFKMFREAIFGIPMERPL